MHIENYLQFEEDSQCNFIMLSNDNNAKENLGLINLSYSLKRKNFTCEIEFFKYKEFNVPCLIINREYSDIGKSLLNKVNKGELRFRLNLAFKNFNNIYKSINSVENNDKDLGIWVKKLNNDLYEIDNKEFIVSFKNNKTLLIIPNPYYTRIPLSYFKEKENENGWHYLKSEYKNNEVLKEIEFTRDNFFKDSCDFLLKCKEIAKNDGVVKIYNYHSLELGEAIGFMSKEDVDFINNYDVFPYEVSDFKLIRKEEALLNSEVLNRKDYNLGYIKAKKRLKKLKKKLKRAKIEYINLEQIAFFNDNWYYWFTSICENLIPKWYTASEIEEIIKSKKLNKFNRFIC